MTTGNASLPADVRRAPPASRAARMEAFDALPPAIRHALHETIYDWCPVDLARHQRREFATWTQLRAHIECEDLIDRHHHRQALAGAAA